jgi:hypothetical protein
MSINIAASHLQQHEVIPTFKMMLQPAMKYTLSSTTLNKLECIQVDQSYLSTILSHMGFNRNTKQLILFGPPSLGAIGFTNTWTDQGIAQVQLFLGQIRKKEEIGLLLHIIMENLQLVIGSSHPLFTYPLLQVLKFCPRNWIINVWDFLWSINGTIQLEKSWHLETQRTNDLFLMDTIMNHLPHFPPKTLKCLNACRIFLQVITLADITDGSGCDILKCSLMGVQHSDWHSSYKWPKQIKPSSEA